MREIVINKCYGGYSLSDEALLLLAKKKDPHIELMDPVEYYGTKDWKKERKDRSPILLQPMYKGKVLVDNHSRDNRDCSVFIEMIKKLGEKANGRSAQLETVTIPYGIEYEIEEYDGIEWVAEKHRTWG